jgi:hypothetical protein
MVFSSASQASLVSLIQGYGGVPAILFDLSTFDEDRLRNVSVLAGHFSWGIWSSLPSVDQSITAPPCFVMGRHPVDRVASYYYERCYREAQCPFYLTPFNDLTPENLTFFISFFRQGIQLDSGDLVFVDEGAQEACCRAMANRKVTSGRPLHDDDIPSALTLLEEEAAIANVGRCVVGLQEEWTDTKRVFEHWFPWVDINADQNEKVNRGRERESVSMIRTDLREVIERMNSCDMRLYEKMRSLFDKQLSVIESIAYL